MRWKFKTMDGNEAAAYASYAFTEIAAIYPITPSSPMAEMIDKWSVQGRKNIFGQEVRLVEMQSEAGAVSTVHGALDAGAIASTYTASQGLLLMIPTMYRIAGEMKPGVIHVASRNVATHAVSINAEHSDVMACRQTGFAMLASSTVQQAMDFSAIAHLSAIRGQIPFLHFFDGFRTSHEVQKVRCLDYHDLAEMVDYEALDAFRSRALNPEHPVLRTTGQYADTYFQSREACNSWYDRLPSVVKDYMDQFNRLLGTTYQPYEYFGAPDAEFVIAGMGSLAGTARETVSYLCSRGQKVGYLDIHLYRPLYAEYFMEALPDTVGCITVADRTKEPGAAGEPLYEDICSLIHEKAPDVKVLACRYGLAGKDTTPRHIAAIFDNMGADTPRNHVTVGINDDVTHLSLPLGPELDTQPQGTINCKFWGLGSDGTVGANKNTIKIIGDHTDLHVQAFFEYDGKKSGGVTRSHLRFGKEPIQSAYLVNRADFVACSNKSYLGKYDILADVKPGGSVLISTDWTDNELSQHLTPDFKHQAAAKNICLYVIDASGIASGLGMAGRTNTILQAAFFKIANIIPLEDALQYMKNAIIRSYGHKGQDVVTKNLSAVDAGIGQLREIQIPESWKEMPVQKEQEENTAPPFIRNILEPVNRMQGDQIPVSTFLEWADGTVPQGTSKYEKRGIAEKIPIWDAEKCIQCNMCAFVCPHGAIRPFLLTQQEKASAPASMETVKARVKGVENLSYRIQVAALDCVGCGSCANVCPAKIPALRMEHLSSHPEEAEYWTYAVSLPGKDIQEQSDTVRGSQFRQPLLEFPGACPGCGETPYAKLVTQLFGDRMLLATATGCSQVWATSFPAFPYTTNSRGQGPAMGSSLFENNAEYGLGLYLSVTQQRALLREKVSLLAQTAEEPELIFAAEAWLGGYEDASNSISLSDALIKQLENYCKKSPVSILAREIYQRADQLAKKSVWIFGGDGWAYDIGYGGLDHILASGENVNVLVFDTEVYSNTGGQMSKATPTGAVAQFAAGGKERKKKDLGMMAMSYSDVYVAQVALGANPAQLVTALREAEAYEGPSLIIAYAPCINHGLRCGMHKVQDEIKQAVEVGYWHLYRYDPLRKKRGEKAFLLDSKEPCGDFRKFLMGEVRFSSLAQSAPDKADILFAHAEQEAMDRYNKYRELAEK